MMNDTKIAELEQYFASINIPDEIRLNNHTYIKDVKKFIKAHLEYAKANIKNPNFTPYVERLQELKTILNQQL